MTYVAGEQPAETDETVPDSDDEATVDHLLEEGPNGPQGRVAMAAAGIDVDERFPIDDEDSPSETAEDNAGEDSGEARPAQSGSPA